MLPESKLRLIFIDLSTRIKTSNKGKKYIELNQYEHRNLSKNNILVDDIKNKINIDLVLIKN